MIDPIWSVLCRSASIDVQEGRISMFDVVEVLNVRGDPEKITKVSLHSELVSLWIRSNPDVPAKGKMRITVLNPKSQTNDLVELDLDLTNGLFLRSRVRIESINVAGPGLYKFQIEVKEDGKEGWKTVAQVPMIAVFHPTPETQEPKENLSSEK